VLFALREEFVKAGYVDPHSVTGEVHALPVYVQPTLRTRLPQRREGSTQGGAGAALVVLRPEQTRERVSGMALSGYGQVGGEGYGLSRVDLDRHTFMLDARRTEQRYRRSEHDLISR
jgi:hypothetical protein